MSTNAISPTRRRLAFATVDEIMPEVDRLLEGHVMVGKWTLGQICNHLTFVISHSVDGFPFRAPWVLRATVGNIGKWYMLKTGRIPDGAPLPRKLKPKPGLDDRAEAEALRAAIRLFNAHGGPWPIHPIMGKLDGHSWNRIHSVHAAHHLGFAVPSHDPAVSQPS